MTNIIEKYSISWFNSKFRGTYFLYNGVPAQVVEALDSCVLAQLSPKSSNGSILSFQKEIPFSFFKDASVFNVPELGWRCTDKGKNLFLLSRNNSSYVRGLSSRNIIVTDSTVTTTLRRRGLIDPRPDYVLRNSIFNPEFIPFNKGIKMMLSGSILSFAVNNDVAVVPGTRKNTLLVKFLTKDIGLVSAGGKLSTTPETREYMENIVCKQ